MYRTGGEGTEDSKDYDENPLSTDKQNLQHQTKGGGWSFFVFFWGGEWHSDFREAALAGW